MQKQEGKVEEELSSNEQKFEKEKFNDTLENQNINTEYLDNKSEDDEEQYDKKFNAYKEKEKYEKEHEQIKEKNEHKPRKKWVLPVIISSIVIVLAIIFSVIFAFINLNSDKIVSGVSIGGIDVSGLTKDEAAGKIQTLVNAKKERDIMLKYQDYETEINLDLIEADYCVNEIVDKAYNVGRSGNIFQNNYEILFTLIGKRNIDFDVKFNDEVLLKTLKDTSSNLPGALKESSYYIEEDNLIVTKGQKGILVDTEKVVEKIKKQLNDINSSNEGYIELVVNEKEPDPIDLDKIHQEVYKEAKDAYYTKEPFQIYPEVNGVDFNVEEAKELLKEDKQEYTIKLVITKPSVTISQIGSEAFPDLLGECKTRYDVSLVNRTTNLRLACQKLNDKVILPGETFSYNKTLGERTIAAGYKEAAIYANGQVVDGLGGGICQISTTLYNAVLHANLEIVERKNHQFVTSYIGAGLDATVVYGLTDFQFKNTRQYPIKISADVQNGIATVKIFGIKEAEEYTITFEVKTIGTIPYSTKYIEDSSLPVGTEQVTQKGTNGLQTETYIVKSLNGKIVSRSLLSKDTYNAMQRIVRKGTKANTTTSKPSTPAPTTQTKPTSSPTTNESTNKTPTTSEDKKPSTGTNGTTGGTSSGSNTSSGTNSGAGSGTSSGSGSNAGTGSSAGSSSGTGNGSTSKEEQTKPDTSSKNPGTTETNKKD